MFYFIFCVFGLGYGSLYIMCTGARQWFIIYNEYMGLGHGSLYLMSIFPNKRNMLILGNIITYILIIASKNHYTIDVLIGSYVSTTLYFLRDKILT